MTQIVGYIPLASGNFALCFSHQKGLCTSYFSAIVSNLPNIIEEEYDEINPNDWKEMSDSQVIS